MLQLYVFKPAATYITQLTTTMHFWNESDSFEFRLNQQRVQVSSSEIEFC